MDRSIRGAISAGLIGGFLLSAFAAAAQTPPLIRLEVSAVDGNDSPVKDLRADEVRVLDDRRSQRLEFFRPWENTGRHVTVVVLNLLDPALRQEQWHQTIHAIERFEASEDLYLYVLTNPSGVLLPVRRLPETAEEAASPPSRWIDGRLSEIEPMRQLVRGPLPSVTIGGFDNSLAAVYSAAETLASRMVRLPGRKNLVWIGSDPLLVRGQDWGRSVSGREMDDKMLHLLSLLDTADIGVYTADLTISRTEDSTVGLNSYDVVQTDNRPRLSEATGGRTYRDDIGRAIARAVADNHSGYRVVYRPQPAPSGSRYRKITVSTTRPGVHVYTKQGYDPATIEGAQGATGREFMDRMTSILWEAPDIALRAEFARDAQKPHLFHFRVHVDAADLLLLPKGNAFSGKLSLLFVSHGEDGREMVSGDPVPIQLDLDREQRNIARRDGIWFPADVILDDATRQVRVIVCDDLAQLAGSATVFISRRPGQ